MTLSLMTLCVTTFISCFGKNKLEHFALMSLAFACKTHRWCNYTEHSYAQLNDTQHNDTQHNHFFLFFGKSKLECFALINLTIACKTYTWCNCI